MLFVRSSYCLIEFNTYILNSKQGLALFRQTPICRSTKITTYKNNNEDFLRSCLMFGCISPNFLTECASKKFLINASFETHSPNWTFTLITSIFNASHPKILQITLPRFKTFVNFFKHLFLSSLLWDLKVTRSH